MGLYSLSRSGRRAAAYRRALIGTIDAAAPAAALVLSDVDGTLLDDRTPLDAVAAGWAALGGRIEVVLASSRTVEELVDLLGELGATADLIAENGACIAVRSAALARALGATETMTRHGCRWYITCRAAPAHAVLTEIHRARDRHAADVVLAAELPPHRQAELLGGDERHARSALTRRCSVLVVPPRPGADGAWLEALARAGVHAAVGGRWLAIWRGLDKGAAAAAYLAARRHVGDLPSQVAAVGDAANDVSLLRAVPTRFVVPDATGVHDQALVAVPGAVALRYAGHTGWREAVGYVLSGTAPAVGVDS